MSLGLIWLAIILLIPVIGLYVLRVNAVPVYLALCVGYVAMVFGAGNANLLVTQGNRLLPANTGINLVFLVLPAIVTAVLSVGSAHGKKRIINLVPSIALGFSSVILITPQLPKALAGSIYSTGYWSTIKSYETTIMLFSSLIILIFLWLSLKNFKPSKHRNKD